MRALVIDLNNFSRYPTVSVGILTSILRRDGIGTAVLSPLALGVDGYPRTTRPPVWGLANQVLRHWSATTRVPGIRRARAELVRRIRPPREANHAVILDAVRAELERGARIVLISAYTMYFELGRSICALAHRHGVPVLVGGNYFSQPEVVERWLRIPGLSAVFGGEPETVLVPLVRGLAAGADVHGVPGLSLPGRPAARPAPPLRDLDALPFPDYTDFPWHRYPNRIIPMMTGRGCGWGACRFCGDIVTSAGRRFRSRSPENVLEEMELQHRRHDTDLFTFLDLKLNSDRAMWQALAEKTRSHVPGARWTASLHFDARRDDGVDRHDLRQAREAGLVRLTTGLESGSPRMLTAMAKGTHPERTSEVLHYAHEAGIGIRLTAMIGYPGERAEDVLATSRFLERHQRIVDRVVPGRLSVMLGSMLHRELEAAPGSHPQISDLQLDPDEAVLRHRNATLEDRHHQRAVRRLLRVVHRINRKPLSDSAREFEGVM